MNPQTTDKKNQYAKSLPKEHPSGDKRFKILVQFGRNKQTIMVRE